MSVTEGPRSRAGPEVHGGRTGVTMEVGLHLCPRQSVSLSLRQEALDRAHRQETSIRVCQLTQRTFCRDGD